MNIYWHKSSSHVLPKSCSFAMNPNKTVVSVKKLLLNWPLMTVETHMAMKLRYYWGHTKMILQHTASCKLTRKVWGTQKLAVQMQSRRVQPQPTVQGVLWLVEEWSTRWVELTTTESSSANPGSMPSNYSCGDTYGKDVWVIKIITYIYCPDLHTYTTI